MISSLPFWAVRLRIAFLIFFSLPAVSLFIVDLAAGNVVRTIDVGDEPTDILFAGTAKELAFVCIAGGFSMPVTNSSPTLVGHGQVKIFDPANPTAAPQVLTLFAKQPRALA